MTKTLTGKVTLVTGESGCIGTRPARPVVNEDGNVAIRSYRNGLNYEQRKAARTTTDSGRWFMRSEYDSRISSSTSPPAIKLLLFLSQPGLKDGELAVMTSVVSRDGGYALERRAKTFTVS